VSQIDKTSVPRTESTIAAGPFFDPEHYKITLLVNDQTASAAEVFAGALRDTTAAKIVGVGSSHTFGKGIVQTVRPLGEDGDRGGMAVTVARYETPAGTDINKKGIKVDFEVPSCGGSEADDEVKCLPAGVWD